MAADEKWKANMEKVAFMKQFPGLLGHWEALTEKPSRLSSRSRAKQGAAVLVFTDGSFIVVPAMAAEPYELGEALTVARTLLEPTHRAAYVEYDQLVKKDKDALNVGEGRKYSWSDSQ